MLRPLFLILFLLITLPVQADVIKIGLRAHSGVTQGQLKWQATADYLSEKIPEHTFVMVPIVSLSELLDAVKHEEFEFVLTNPSSSVEMEERYGVSQLVTLKNLRQGKPYTVFGSVVFTRKDNSNIKTFHDLTGKKLVAVSEQAFGGWRVALQEMMHQGMNPVEDLAELNFSGGIQEDVVYAVSDGRYDAGVVRTDMLERMAAKGEINIDDFSVINKMETPGFPFMHSTRLFPEWPFSKLKKTSNNLAQKVSLALLSMPHDHEAAIKGKYEGWTVVEDYQPVKTLMQELKIGPFQLKRDDVVQIVIDEFGGWLMGFFAGFIIIVLVIAYVVRINRNLAIETKQKDKANANLKERVKEINCLYTISRIMSETDDIPKALVRIVDVLPSSFMYPDICSARVSYHGREFVTEGFSDSLYKLNYPLNEAGEEAGFIEVCYSKCIKKHDSGPFLKEEVVLLKEVAKRLSDYFDRCFNANLLLDSYSELETRVNARTEELEKAKIKAEKASMAKSDFLSKMSHELRTPMNAILGFSELLMLDAEKKSDDEKDYINEIKMAGDHLLCLIDEVLDLSRIEQGKLEPSLQQLSVSKLLRETISLMEPLAAKYDVSIEAEIMDAEISTDSKLFKQIFINLATNAIKYNKKGGKVSMGMENCGDDVICLTVSDTGEGIPLEMQDNLFEPFVRLDRDKAKDGVGIGLSVVKGLVETLGGKIELQSYEGEGTCFKVKLPRNQSCLAINAG